MSGRKYSASAAVALRASQIRKSVGLSRRELAARSGLSANTIENIERCRKAVSVDELIALAAGLGISVDSLLQIPTSSESTDVLLSRVVTLETELAALRSGLRRLLEAK